jgi:hypothetical protein
VEMIEETQACDSKLRNGKLKRIEHVLSPIPAGICGCSKSCETEKGEQVCIHILRLSLNLFFKELTCFVLAPESGVIPLPLIVGVEASQSVSVTQTSLSQRRRTRKKNLVHDT